MTAAAPSRPPRPSISLLLALIASLALNVLLWRRPAVATPPPSGDQPAVPAKNSPPRWAPALTASPAESGAANAQDACATLADSTRELERLNAELLVTRPYQEQFAKGRTNAAARRWYDAEIAPRFGTPPAGASVAYDCRGPICRIDVTIPPVDRGPFDKWIQDVLAPFDTQQVNGDDGRSTRYLRIPEDRSVDGREILARIDAKYSWSGVREVCEREGALNHTGGVHLEIRPDPDGAATFGVKLIDRMGRWVPEVTAAEICVSWSVHKMLDRTALPRTATQASLDHFFAPPLPARVPGLPQTNP